MVLGNSPEVAAGSSASPTVSNGAFLVVLLTGWYLLSQFRGNARPKRATRPHPSRRYDYAFTGAAILAR